MNKSQPAQRATHTFAPQMELQAALFQQLTPVRDGKMRTSIAPQQVTSLASTSAGDKTDNHDFSFDDPLQSPDMRREDERLKTFEKWPVVFMRPEDLAKSGFYYLGRADEVRCAFCKVEIMRWEEGDDPAVDHQKWAPQCPLLQNAAPGNVPIAAATDVGRDECGVRIRTPGPANAMHASESARLRTFKDWPRSMRQRPEDLAEAGFYYTGQGDKTKCFYCDGGLKDWEDADIPWEQHARWFPRCAFVQLVKGKEYVQKVNSEEKALVKSEEDKKKELEEQQQTSVQSAATTPENEKKDANMPDDTKICKICFAEERNICFIPCGHVVACAKCALAADKCPMCRRTLQGVVRLYYS